MDGAIAEWREAIRLEPDLAEAHYNLGVALNEICDLEELGQSCAEDGQYTFLYTAAPIKFKYATGAPANPVVIK